MTKFFKASYLLIILAALIWAGCAGTKTSKEDAYLGDWEYLVEGTPNGDVTGVMNIAKDGDAFVGKLTSDMGEIELNDLSIVEDKLSANFEIQGMTLDMDGTFNGPQFTGTIGVDYNTFPVTATKK
jgi:hypothetical protein